MTRLDLIDSGMTIKALNQTLAAAMANTFPGMQLGKQQASTAAGLNSSDVTETAGQTLQVADSCSAVNLLEAGREARLSQSEMSFHVLCATLASCSKQHDVQHGCAENAIGPWIETQITAKTKNYKSKYDLKIIFMNIFSG